MNEDRLKNSRLEVLAHYRNLGPGERFFLWFSYPGLRDEFEAIDRATGGGGNLLLRPGPEPVRTCRSGPRRRWCFPCLMFRPPARASR